jgi:flagellar assembly protein FliH
MSTVIKAGQAGKFVRRLAKVDLVDHLREATAVVDGARAQAVRIITDAEERARRAVENAGEKGRADGFDKGYAEGVAAGRDAALEQGRIEFAEKHAGLAGMFQAAIAWIDETKEPLRLTAEKDLLDFAVLTASKLTFAVGALHREAACENFRRALTLVTDKTDVTVRCNAKDVETLRVFAETVLDSARSGHGVRLIEDDSVSPGGCVLRSGKAEVDASLETQVAEMVSILVGKNSNA